MLQPSEEPSSDVVSEVVSILDMWDMLETSYQRLSKEDKAKVEKEAEPFGKNVQFRGFDGNNESEYMNVARFLVDDLDRFSAFACKFQNYLSLIWRYLSPRWRGNKIRVSLVASLH